MVCDRCKMVVRAELNKIGLTPFLIQLGEVELAEEKLSKDVLRQIDAILSEVGFELIDNRLGRIIEKIKKVIITVVHSGDEYPSTKFSEYISQQLHYDYSYLSRLFSQTEGITIEHYIIYQKIERAKELIFYDELSFKSIAYQLGYSSPAHLSAQFKKLTGMTPKVFKGLQKRNRTGLDKVGII